MGPERAGPRLRLPWEIPSFACERRPHAGRVMSTLNGLEKNMPIEYPHDIQLACTLLAKEIRPFGLLCDDNNEDLDVATIVEIIDEIEIDSILWEPRAKPTEATDTPPAEEIVAECGCSCCEAKRSLQAYWDKIEK